MGILAPCWEDCHHRTIVSWRKVQPSKGRGELELRCHQQFDLVMIDMQAIIIIMNICWKTPNFSSWIYMKTNFKVTATTINNKSMNMKFPPGSSCRPQPSSPLNRTWGGGQLKDYRVFDALTASITTMVGGELIYPKLPKTKKTQCYQTFSGAVLCIKAGENFEFGERWCLTPCTWGLKIWKSPLKIVISK